MPIELLIGMAASIILSVIKNPQHKATFKSVMLKIRNSINAIYVGDPDFK